MTEAEPSSSGPAGTAPSTASEGGASAEDRVVLHHGTQSTGSRRGRRGAALISLAFLMISLPVVLGSYGRLDDYSQLLSVQEQGPGALIEWSMSFGRPLNFIVNALLLDVVDSVEGLWVLRLTAAIGVALGAFVLARAAAAPSHDPLWTQLCVPALVFALPGTWVFITWAQGAGHAVALLCASTGCYLALRAEQVQGSARFFLYSACGLLVLMAIFSYQTLGLAIPGLVLACGLLANRPRQSLRSAIVVIPITLMAFAANVALVQISGSAEVEARAGLTSDWSGKTAWIARELLPRVVWPFSITPRVVVALITSLVVILLLVGAATVARRGGYLRRFLVFVLVAGVTVSLPIAPLVVIGENWASSRAVLAAALVLWLFILALVSTTAVSRSDREADSRSSLPRGATRLVWACTIALVIGGLFGAFRAYVGLAAPAVSEWRETRAIWLGTPPTVTKAEVQLAPLVSPDTLFVSYDEYGLSSGGIQWSSSAMHELAAENAAHLELQPNNVIVSTVPGTCDSGPLEVLSSDRTTLRINPINTPQNCGIQD